MKVQPRTEKEIAEANLWAEGIYEFEVVTADDHISKAGNDMIKLSVRLHRDDGATTTVDDYLMDGDRTAYKVRHFAEAVGMLTQYERGNLDPREMTNRAGRCKVRIQKDKNGQFPDKNGIADYVKRDTAPIGGDPRPIPPIADDEIPF